MLRATVMNWQDTEEGEEEPGEGCSHDWYTLRQAKDVEGQVGDLGGTHRASEDVAAATTDSSGERGISPEAEVLPTLQT